MTTTVANQVAHALNLKFLSAPSSSTDKAIPSSYNGFSYTSFDIESGELLKKFLEALTPGSQVIVIHDTDMDGTMAGLLLSRYLLNNCKAAVIVHDAPVAHGGSFHEKAIEEIKNRDECEGVIVLDHAFNGEVYQEAISKGKKLLWVDHHPVPEHYQDTVIDPEQFMPVIDSTYSTAELVSRMCMSHSFLVDGVEPLSNVEQMLAYYTHFHDSWQYPKGEGFEHESYCKRVRGLVSWFYSEPMKREILDDIMNMGYTEGLHAVYALIDAGESFAKFQSIISKNVSLYNVGFLKWKLDDVEYRIGYTFHSSDRSNVAKEILQVHKDKINAALVIYRHIEDDLVYFSLRGSDQLPPVNAIASHLGGGGHRNAAGFTVKPSEIGQYLQDCFFENKKESA